MTQSHLLGPWVRASSDFTTLDVDTMQSWLLDPPIEATHVRVCCTRNAARARLDEARQKLHNRGMIQLDLEGNEDRELALQGIPPMVGFFQVGFD